MTSATTMGELARTFPFLTPRPSADHPAWNCPPDRVVEVLQYLRDERGYDLLVDITAIDWSPATPRYSGVYHVFTTARNHYVRVVVPVADDAEPMLPTVTHLWAAADWHEREAYDMFGIRFLGHPDLRRILMWDGYPYHPLRKDFPLAGIDTDLPAADVAAETGARVIAAPMMGGPFRSDPGQQMSEMEPLGRDESWTEKRPKPEEPREL